MFPVGNRLSHHLPWTNPNDSVANLSALGVVFDAYSPLSTVITEEVQALSGWALERGEEGNREVIVLLTAKVSVARTLLFTGEKVKSSQFVSLQKHANYRRWGKTIASPSNSTN